MKRRFPTGLARALHRFFQEYLPVQRGMSLHTLRSYRDALLLLLRYTAQDTRRRIEALELDDFTAERVTRFLRHLETQRQNGVATRNARLAALHTFARFLIASCPERIVNYQRVLSIPFKRGAQRVPIDYLELNEVEALLGNINQKTPAGQRDYALFALMFNTGARVQEILNLKVRDVRFDPPNQVRLLGKGNKVRLCPIWSRTAKLLQQLVASVSSSNENPADACLFQNRRGEPLTRFGVRYLLRKHLPKRLADGPSGLNKRLHPHSLRHTTAVYLLKSGVDVATISQWLGHATLNTTIRYARADMDLKRQALSQVFPEILGAPKGGRLRLDGTEITTWLSRL
jgi:site-specific recombinase XerD